MKPVWSRYICRGLCRLHACYRRLPAIGESAHHAENAVLVCLAVTGCPACPACSPEAEFAPCLHMQVAVQQKRQSIAHLEHRKREIELFVLKQQQAVQRLLACMRSCPTYAGLLSEPMQVTPSCATTKCWQVAAVRLSMPLADTPTCFPDQLSTIQWGDVASLPVSTFVT